MKIKLCKKDYIKLQEHLVSLMELIDSLDLGGKDKDLLTVPVQMCSRYYRGEYYYNNELTEYINEEETHNIYAYRQPKKLKKIQSFEDDTDYIKKQKIAELKKKRRKENRIKRLMEEEQ